MRDVLGVVEQSAYAIAQKGVRNIFVLQWNGRSQNKNQHHAQASGEFWAW